MCLNKHMPMSFSLIPYYLCQCWLVVNKNKLKWNLNHNIMIFIQWNAFQNVVCKLSVILHRPQYVDYHPAIREHHTVPCQGITGISYTVIILWMCPTNEIRCYHVTSSLIGWVHTQNDHCIHRIKASTLSCHLRTRGLLHSSTLVALGLSVRYETWPPIGWHQPVVPGSISQPIFRSASDWLI